MPPTATAYRHPGFSRATAGSVRVNPGQREHQLCADLPITGWRLKIRGELNPAELLAAATKDKMSKRTDCWKGLRQ